MIRFPTHERDHWKICKPAIWTIPWSSQHRTFATRASHIVCWFERDSDGFVQKEWLHLLGWISRISLNGISGNIPWWMCKLVRRQRTHRSGRDRDLICDEVGMCGFKGTMAHTFRITALSDKMKGEHDWILRSESIVCLSCEHQNDIKSCFNLWQ